jgi:hypothetical protein
MNFEALLESIPVITEEELEANKLSLEDILHWHPLLSYDEPLLYAIFLSHRPDLNEHDKNCIRQIIKRLNDNEHMKVKQAVKDMSHAESVLDEINNIYA